MRGTRLEEIGRRVVSEEFAAENGNRYVVDGNVLEVWSWTGESQIRIRLDLIEPVEYKGKWGTHMIKLKVSSHAYIVTDAGEQSPELANWLEAARQRAAKS